MISWNLCCASSHWVVVRWSCWSICVRVSIARFCLSRNIVCRFWRLLGGIGYVILGIFVAVVVSLMTIVLGASCSITG